MSITAEELTELARAWVEREFPTARVESSGPLRLRLELPDGWSFDSSLESTWAACREGDAADVEAHLRRWVTTLHTIRDRPTRTVDSLMPVVRNAAMRDELEALGGEPYSRPLGGDLVVMLAFDQPTSLEYASLPDIEALGVGEAEAELAALRNLQAGVSWRLEGEGDLRMVVADGTFESSLMLLPMLREESDPDRRLCNLLESGESDPDRRLCNLLES